MSLGLLRNGPFWQTLSVLVFAMAALVSGQEIDDDPTQLWLSYQHQHKVAERVRAFGTLGYKELTSTERFFGEWTRLFIRVGASYEVSSKFRLAGAFDVHYTYQPESDDFFEVRPWQEAKLFWPERNGWLRRFVLVHRIRLEERFLDSGEEDFQWRLRYRLGTKISLNTHDVKPRSVYLLLAAEYFADLGSETSERFTDEGRASIGLGYVSSPAWIFDLRYHRQRSRVTVAEDFRTNDHVIDFSVRTSVRILDLIKGQ
jgi:hypothetical protein